MLPFCFLMHNIGLRSFRTVAYHSQLTSFILKKRIDIPRAITCLMTQADYSGQSHDPRNIFIPLDKIEFSFARSSGPGGQNVNKLNTKAEVRFRIADADWIPDDVKSRLTAQQANRINKEGELVITCQENRTQAKNKDDCLKKLKEILQEAYIEPKERNMWEGIGEKGKQLRREEKNKKSEVKQARRSKNFNDWD